MTELTKVFGIGYPKTGTKSLAVALKLLGYNVLHDELRLMKDRAIRNDLSALKDTEFDAFLNVNPKAFFVYDREFPDSKFILTTRDPNQWVNSVRHWRQKLDKAIRINDLTIADLFYTDSYSVSVLLEYIENYSCIATDDESYIYKFTQHTEEVKSYFKDRPQDLLILDTSQPNDNHVKLSEFLSIPWPPASLYPHENRGLSHFQKHK